MKGLKEFALSCMLFGCAANAMATEIASNLLKLDPLVYFGAESFELDATKGLNRGRAELHLGFSSVTPGTAPSFLGAHAGQALQFAGEDALSLQLPEIPLGESLDEGLVLGFFAASDPQASAGQQCLLSVGNDIALTLQDNTFKAYQRHAGVRTVESPDMAGPAAEGSAIFLVFSDSRVEVYKGFDRVWEFALEDGAQSLSAAQIVLGNCASQVKTALIEEAIEGFQGGLDELVLVANQDWRDFAPMDVPLAHLKRPTAPAAWPLAAVSQSPSAPSPMGPKAAFSAADAFCTEDEGELEPEPEPSLDDMDYAPDSSAIRVILMMAGQGAYPLQAQLWSNGSYRLVADSESAFVGFVYPTADDFLPIEQSATLRLQGQSELENLYHSQIAGQVEFFHKGEGFFMLSPVEGEPNQLNVECYGDTADCQNFYARTDLGIAFAMPRAVEPIVFDLQGDDLPTAYDRALRRLDISFTDSLTGPVNDPQVISSHLVKLYRALDEAGEDWSPVSIESIQAFGERMELHFSPRLTDGRYRLEFDAALSSHAGMALGEMQRYEFSVTSSEWRVPNSTTLGEHDYQHDGKRLIVDGVTLTLSGEHDFESVTVLNAGVITTPTAKRLLISADEIAVDAASRIDATAKGRPGNTAIGTYTGGSYGGSGGAHNFGATNAIYGDFREPKDFGTGGRSGGSAYTLGGGSIELQASVLKLDGRILANGSFSTSNYGSGSGGSLLLRVGQLVLGEQARIEASGGGSTAAGVYGGGGGGRVALYYKELLQGSLTTQLWARGGLSNSATGALPGGAGSIYLQNTETEEEELLFKNTGVSTTAPMVKLDLQEPGAYSGKLSLVSVVAQLLGEPVLASVSGSAARLLGSYRTADDELIVDGYTLELNRSGSWSKVRVINSGVITTPLANAYTDSKISIAADEIEVDASSRIDVSARGLPGLLSASLQSGGSYGGSGGVVGGASNAPYGDFREPRDFGTGGRSRGAGTTRGGGAIELVAEVLRLDGRILANGQALNSSDSSTGYYGSGSGGSVLLRVGRLALGEAAVIEANGAGFASEPYRGGGGGGRVALHYGELSQGDLAAQLWAKGGLAANATPGAAGSIYLKNTTTEVEELIFKNTGVPTTAPLSTLDLQGEAAYGGKLTLIDSVLSVLGDAGFSAVSVTNGRVVGSYRNADNELLVDGHTLELNQSGTWSKVRVINGGVLTTPFASAHSNDKISVTADEIEVDASSRIDVSSRGLLGNSTQALQSGGSYGGQGGSSSYGVANAPYGDYLEPRDFGSGGRNNSSGYTRGGGAIELNTQLLKLEGRILANGQAISSTDPTSAYGSGSGGSILLRVARLHLGETARIEANGGGSTASFYQGGGGGGRLALFYGELQQGNLATQLSARGGYTTSSTVGTPGAAGSIYLKNTGTQAEELIFNNTGVWQTSPYALLDLRGRDPYAGIIRLINANTLIRGDVANEQIVRSNSLLSRSHIAEGGELLVDNYRLILHANAQWSAIRVINSGVISTVAASANTEQAIVLSAEEIFVDATSRIDVDGAGTLAPATVGIYSGGSHGGYGGVYQSNSTNLPYGDFREPQHMGSGGVGNTTSTKITRGGGAIEISAELLRLDGIIRTNGQSGSTSGGGGSGGSLLLRVANLELAETARIEANGGAADSSYGGGGGGRVAVYYGTVDRNLLLQVVSAKGGGGTSRPGAAGTVYLQDNQSGESELLVDNSQINTTAAAITLLDFNASGGEFDGKLTLRNANVRILGASLALLDINGGTVYLQVDELANLQSLNAQIFQQRDLQVAELQMTGGRWTQSGYSLHADNHLFSGTVLNLSGAFNGAETDLLVNGFTLELAENRTWQKVRVINGGIITTTLEKVVSISADEVEVDSTSRIDVSSKGSLGTNTSGHAGGSYGGWGGVYSTATTNAPYGSFEEPRNLGRGGRINGSNTTRGGGAIELQARLLKLDGRIFASGQGHYSAGGGASGGSILLKVDTLQLGSTSFIVASGGVSTYAGGSGGRIAIHYREANRSDLLRALQARGGMTSDTAGQYGAAGTIYLNDLSVERAELIVDNTSRDRTRSAKTLISVAAPGELAASLTALSANLDLNVSKLDAASLQDSQLIQRKALQVPELNMSGGRWDQAGFALDAETYAFAGGIHAMSGPFSGAVDNLLVDGYTLELDREWNWGTVRVLNGGVITIPAALLLPTSGVSITADEIEVDASSKIDVSGKGLLPSAQVGSYCGGSHGGLGGRYNNCSPAPVFGDYLGPVTHGIGGRYSGTTYPTRGGGAIKLVTGSFKLHGQLLANGERGADSIYSGGGAGGSIWVNTQVLQGSATTRIQALGGAGRTYGGPGGGGRIAIYYSGMQGINALGQISVAAGARAASDATTAAQQGSLHLENRVVPTAVANADVGGLTNRAISKIAVDFINAIDAESLTPEVVTLIGPSGPVPVQAVSAVNSVRYQLDLGAILGDGEYELRVGPGIRSAQGLGMDQNGNGIADEPEDVFVRSFVVDRTPPEAPHVSSPLVAPAINALNLRKTTLQGVRSEESAILVNGVLRVALGSGPWTVVDHALDEGDNSLQVRARDVAGNLSPVTLLNFSVDSIAPSVQQYSHSGSTRVVPSSVWVRFNEAGTGLDFAGSSLTLRRNGVIVSGQLSLEDDVLRLTPNSTLLEGNYSVAVSLQDKARNLRVTSFSFVLDYTPPLAPVVNAYPAMTTNKQMLISGSKENGSTLRIFNAANTQLTSISGSATTWQYTLTLVPGDNSFRVNQYDAAGNLSPSTTVQVRFDDEAPGPVAFTLDPKGSGTEVKLAWPSYSEAANGNDIQQYRIYSALQPFSQISQAQLLLSVPSGSKQAVVKNLARGEERHFAVVAVDLQGLLLQGVTSQATTPQDVQAPTEASALVVKSAAEQLELSWQASANAAGDLAGYALYVGEGNAQRIDLPLAGLGAGLRYTLSGLAPASATALRLVAVDNDGNESTGLRTQGITWLSNPATLQLEPFSNRVEASWAAVTPAEWVSGYRLYVADEPFTSVQGKTAKLSTTGQLAGRVSGLLNNKTYHMAVTVVNASGGENPQVQSFSVTPAADSQGPQLVKLTWHSAQGQQDLTAGGELQQLGEWRIQATDESGIGSIALSLAGQPLGQATQAGSYYRHSWNLSQVADGDYRLAIELRDTLGNTSQHEVDLRVALAAPAAPSLSLQSKASQTNKAQQVLIVQGQAGSLAQISHNGSEQAELLTLDGSGQAQLPLTLEEGDNQLSARLRYSSREQFGAVSAVLNVNLDSALPNAPANLQATAKAQGVVQLSWAAVNGVAGYDLYAANQPFSEISDAGVSKLNSKALTSPSYQHQSSSDGTYYYRVRSFNSLGSTSVLSAQQSAQADRTPPRVEEASYNSQGAVSADGRYAPGRVDVRLRMSEALRNAPFFSLDVPQGVSIPVRMTQAANDPLVYQGSFDLNAAVPSGLLYARVSAYDPVGNEGSEVVEGKTLRVDTQGPDLQQLSLLPESPVENLLSDNQGRELQVVLRLSEDPASTPQLTPRLDGQALASQSGPLELSLDAQSQAGAPVYTGRFRLPSDAGQQGVQLLGFDYQGRDDLGNISQRILGRRDFQVYQGQLPPLDMPQGLSGKALAGGRVALNWSEVKEASAYQLYRRSEADSSFTAVGRVRELTFEDNLPVAGLADGIYYYQVASIREHDGKEALSLPSAAVKVQVLSQAPSAPRDLGIELNGAGIILRWLAPEMGQVVSYNLYRANVGQGQAIDISGRTPLQSKIPERIALDSRPSDSEHAYTVTAVDAAGNESPAATSVYLNAGLLPVRDLSIRLAEGQVPRLQWDHGGKDVVGYNLYVGADAQKLNAELITGKTYSDANVSLPLSGERLYSVTAVDAQGVESLPHALLLPAVKAELRGEQRFDRGVFNQLHYQVANSGSTELKRLRLRVDVDSGGQIKPHLSDYFNVAAGAVAEVPVVVAGYQDLPGVVPLSVEVLYAPQVGESVSIQRSESISAGENSLLVQLLADEFTRGTSGSVRIRLENPSAVASELVTAHNSGNQASSEMRLILEDLQGNVLASQAVKAAVGNGLVTVRDGRTVARVGAFDVLETGPFSIQVPSAAPDRVRLRLEADFLHYQTALPGELKIGGLRSSRELSLVETPYYGEITEVSPPQVQAGDSVTIRGRALSRDNGQPLGKVDLRLILNVRGFERVVTLKTDEQGAFQHVVKTTSDDSGEHMLSLIHPSIQLRPQHGRFLVQGAAFSPASVNTSFPRNYQQTVTVVVEAGYDTSLKNVRLEAVGYNLPSGVKVVNSTVLNLNAKQRGNLVLRISGDNTAAASGLLDYRIVADGLARPIGQTRIQYKLVEAPSVVTQPSAPAARVSPLQVRTGLAREAERVERVTLSNPGNDVLRNVRLTLLADQGASLPSWISLDSAAQLGNLPAGAQHPIGVVFKPGVGVAEGDYYLSLRIDSDNHPSLTVPMSVAVTQSGKGGVIFQVEDIYTGTLDSQGQRILGLKGARLKLQNRNVLSTEFTATSDDRGQVLLEDIPAGEYNYRISAWDHDDISGQLWIKPGVVESERVFLMSKLVTVEWSVKEITIEDRYEIKLNATFKTNVPTALVMIEPLAVNLPAMRKGDVFQGELTVSNYGLIRADEVRANLPVGDARARIEYLHSVPDTLEAGEVRVIPYRIVALQSFDPEDVLNGAAGCWSFSYQGSVNYKSQCANGQVIPGQANVAWSANGRTGSCVATGTGGGGLLGGGASGWGGWGGGGGGGGTSGSGGVGFIPRPTPLGSSKQCPPPPDCENGNCGGGNGGTD